MKRLLLPIAVPILLAAISLRADSTLVFNEIMYHPATDEPTLEWVEFRNQLAVDLDISGWSVTGGIEYTFPSNTVVRGRGFLVLAIDPNALQAETGLTTVYGSFVGRLSNDGELLNLRNNNRRIVDSIDYGVAGNWPVGPDGSGVSLAKRDRESASGPAENWTSSEQVGGTPGAENFPPVPPDLRAIAIDQALKYEGSAADPGTSWRGLNYDDSGWLSRHAVTNRSISNLFNTGVGANRAVLAAGASDPHYVLTANAQGGVGTNALAMQNHTAWAANDANSSWIGIINSGLLNINPGDYNFRTTFTLDNYLLDTVQIDVRVAVDNDMPNILLNGVPSGLSHVGFASFSGPLTLNRGFVAGINTLEFLTINQPPGANPGGFRAEFTSSGLGLNQDNPLPPGRVTYYFRKPFLLPGNPDLITLRLNAVISDGAVFYVNGVEVHRINMPAGEITATTPALSDVISPSYSGSVALNTAGLLGSSNVLAIELHQAAGGADTPLAAAELIASFSPEPPVTIGLNEHAPAGPFFWVEILNYGAAAFDLADARIVKQGVVDELYTFEGGTLNGGGFLVISNVFEFGVAAGDRLFFFDGNRLLDSIVVGGRLRGRLPDGTGQWLFPNISTPGSANSFVLRDEIVINEIMYNPKLVPPTNNLPARPSPEEWLELHNRSGAPVVLTGWRLEGGIEYAFTAGQTIPAGGYLVVSDDAEYLRALHPSITIVGNFNGRLSGRSDRIVLLDPSDNPADEVRYFDGGAWPGYADGGGSSLELRDPDADNSKPEAWAASDESNKTSWQTYTYRWTAVTPSVAQPSRFNEFILGFLGDGECLIDDISVIQAPTTTPVPFIDNGDFENGLSGWRVLGNHNRSQVIVEPGNPGNHVLHVTATGPQEHMHNHIERTYIAGRSIVNGTEYQISFRARWLAGNHLLNTRLYFNRFARTTALPYVALSGTPGAENSRREANIGPTFSELRHERVVPQPGESVTVSALAQDPDGVAGATLFWSVNGGSFNSNAMSILSGGRLVGNIPGHQARSIVQFYIRAVDGLEAAADYPAAGAASGALYTVADGLNRPLLGHNFRIVLSPANTALMHASTNVMSNDSLPCTVIYGEQRAYYNASVRLKSSERGRDNAARVSFHLTFPADDLFRGVHPVMLFDRSPGGSSPAQEEIVIRHILLRAGGIPAPNPDLCWLIPPNPAQTGPAILAPRFEDEFAETHFENGGDGTFFELELIYSPQGANAAGYKLPQPDDVTSVDFQDLGNDKENYRYNFIIKNHREEDDYSRFIPFAKIFSMSGAVLEQQARQLMDVDEWLRAYALVSLCGVGDMYTYGLPHNWMVYQRADDGKFLYFPWDMDFSFTRGTGDPLVGNAPASDSRFNKIVNLPTNLRRYYAHVLDLIDISFNPTYMTYWLDHYDNFAPPQNYTGRAAYIQNRITAARTEINNAGGNAAFTISGANVITNGTNLIVFTGTAPVGVQTIEVNGRAYPITWTSVSAWRMVVPVFDATNELQFAGYDLNGNLQTNAMRTNIVYYTGVAPDPQGQVVINEIMYNPVTPNTAFVELHNRSSVAFDLSDWRINGLDYTFPKGSIITNGQYLLLVNQVAAYAAAFGTNAVVPFDEFPGNLQNNGETLTLFRPGANPGEEIVVDKVKYEAILPWPLQADGLGASLQLVDSQEDNARVGNWSDGAGWRQIILTGTNAASASSFLIFLNSVGDVHIDDVVMVLGGVPEAGTNLVVNGDFEADLAPAWTAQGNHLNSARSTAVSHSGAASLRVLSTGAGGSGNLIRQTIPTFPTQTVCTLSFWMLPTTNGNLITIRTQPGNNFNATTTVRPVLSSPGVANTVSRDAPPFPDLYLNEVQPENVTGPLDGQGEREPWIEIYNAGSTSINLEGYYLANNYSNTTQWAFPVGSSIGPGEFKYVFADNEPSESTATEWHANFRPQAGQGSIALSSSSMVLDYLNYAAIRPDWSFGAYPDGQLFLRQPFYRPTPGGTNDNSPPPITVVINEWMASNTRTLMNTNNNNRFDDWFELHNPSEFPADLTGYWLTDNLTNKFQFVIPPGYVIPPHGFLLVWADNEDDLNNTNDAALHASFALERNGEQIGLVTPDGDFVDSITFERQFTDITEGRYPDAAFTAYFLSSATPKAPNTIWTNRAPVINPIPDQSALVGQPFSYYVLATDPDGHILRYNRIAAPTNSQLDFVTGQFTWTPPSASTNFVTVEVFDNGPLALRTSSTFRVVATTGIRIGTVTRVSANELSVSLAAVPGKTYRAEFKDNLTDEMWTPIEPGTLATGQTVSISIPIGPGHRFFRIGQVD